MSGRLVVLNGPSSAGKTTLANAVADLLPTPWHVTPVDLFHSIRSRPDLRGVNGIEWEPVFRATRAGFHRAVAGMAAAGCDVLADHVLSEPWRLRDLLEVTACVDVLLVHVTCSLDVLVERERSRGDREAGTAASHLGVVFAHGDCDLTVDTGRTSLEECARAVVDLLEDPPDGRAFDRLRRIRTS